jgi:hypothetical protein
LGFSRKMTLAAADNRDYVCTCEEESEAYDPNVPSWLCRHRDCFAREIGACQQMNCREPGPGTCDCMYRAFHPEDGPNGEPPSRPINLLKLSQRVAYFREEPHVNPWVLWDGEDGPWRAMWARMDFVGPPRLLS